MPRERLSDVSTSEDKVTLFELLRYHLGVVSVLSPLLRWRGWILPEVMSSQFVGTRLVGWALQLRRVSLRPPIG